MQINAHVKIGEGKELFSLDQFNKRHLDIYSKQSDCQNRTIS